MEKYKIVVRGNTWSCGFHDKSMSCFLVFFFLKKPLNSSFLSDVGIKLVYIGYACPLFSHKRVANRTLEKLYRGSKGVIILLQRTKN